MKYQSEFNRGQKDGNRDEYNPPSLPFLFPSQEQIAKRAAYDKGYKEGKKQRDNRRRTRR